MIELKYSLLLEDYHKFIAHGRRRCMKNSANAQRGAYRFGLWGTIVLGVVVIIIWSLQSEINNLSLLIKSFFIGVVISYLCLKYFAKLQMQAADPKMSGSILGEKIVIIDEQGFSQKCTHSKNWISWDIVEEVSQTKEHVFIYTDTATAKIIPKRIFESENDLDVFLIFLKEQLSKRKQYF